MAKTGGSGLLMMGVGETASEAPPARGGSKQNPLWDLLNRGSAAAGNTANIRAQSTKTTLNQHPEQSIIKDALKGKLEDDEFFLQA